ncbi:TonB-dependent receptor [Methylomonas sp. SURF-2]|uniref:TonB-dependent receptor n=1 Tax=Methylomonas subterranea TaxID=2952225 RepID=A0ABT1TKN2_9GAMM|nr:TonB-dependent receptor [Methylomonas sp. SURF-2]MCQ8106010.1 TonB-dependent receptor [Methylomonas sp. SURF-2]
MNVFAKPRKLIGAALLLISSARALAIHGDSEDLTGLSLEELLNVEIISASRLGQDANKAPASISVLTADDIRTFGWRTLAEALNAMRGLYASNDRNYSYLGVRGFQHPNDYNSRVLIMIDGQRMNENLYDGGYVGQEFMLDIGLIERIEFIPGSGSSIYGANAFSGLINVVSKNGGAIGGAQLAGQVGSFDTYQGRASFGKTLENGADILLSASHYDSAGVEKLYFGEFDQPSNNNGIARNMDTERADRLFGKFKFQDFSLSAGYVDRYKRIPTAAYGSIFNDPQTHTTDQQFFSNLTYQKALTDKNALRLKGFYQGYSYKGEYPYDAGGRVVNSDSASGRWWGGEAQLTSTAFERHRLLLGLEYQYDQRQRQLNYDSAPYNLYLDSHRNGHRLELYGQDDIQILDELIFSAGLRLDYHHMLKNLQLNPRLGLIWNPLDSATFKLLYSSSFRAPNAWERDYSSFANTPNPNNSEERIKSYEGVAEWRSGSGLKLVGAVFFNDMTRILEQIIEPGFGAAGPFINKDHYHALGFELEAEQHWDSGRYIKASYSNNRLSNETAGASWAPASPRNLFKLHYAEPLFDNFAKLGIENIFVDERRTSQTGVADAYYQLNLNLSSDRIAPGLDVSVGAYNLFDSHYQMLGGTGPNDIAQNILRMNGREFRLNLQFTY